jgi:hypothetical protein
VRDEQVELIHDVGHGPQPIMSCISRHWTKSVTVCRIFVFPENLLSSQLCKHLRGNPLKRKKQGRGGNRLRPCFLRL